MGAGRDTWRSWTEDGTWERILDRVIVEDDAVGDLEWITSVDLSVVRTHQPLVPGRKGGCGDVIEALALVARSGSGRLRRCRTETVIAGKAYAHPSTRWAMRGLAGRLRRPGAG